jgi:hypothetical protein
VLAAVYWFLLVFFLLFTGYDMGVCSLNNSAVLIHGFSWLLYCLLLSSGVGCCLLFSFPAVYFFCCVLYFFCYLSVFLFAVVCSIHLLLLVMCASVN